MDFFESSPPRYTHQAYLGVHMAYLGVHISYPGVPSSLVQKASKLYRYTYCGSSTLFLSINKKPSRKTTKLNHYCLSNLTISTILLSYVIGSFENLVTISVTRLGDFWKLSMTNIHSKVVQMLSDFLGFLQTSFSTKAWLLSGQLLEKMWLLFIPTSDHPGHKIPNYNNCSQSRRPTFS